MKQLFLVEDDLDLGASLQQFLEMNQFHVIWCKDGEEALQRVSSPDCPRVDLFVLDVMMPKMDGFTLAEKLVEIHPETPFLFLTARKTKEDRLQGLKLGADDYIAKPFEVDELVLRIKNIISRATQQGPFQTETTEEISIGTYHFNLHNLTLIHNKETQKLTEKEAKLIHFLYANRNKVISREDILMRIWHNTDFFSGRSMDVFISRVRKRFKNDQNISIKSIRGVGLEFTLNQE